MRISHRVVAVCVVALALVVGFPRVVLAHGIGGRLDLPLPLPYFIVGAGIVLVVSFVALAILWPEPRLQSRPRYEAATDRAPVGWLRPILGVIGLIALLAVIGQVVSAVLGVERALTRPTIAPVTVWVVFWLVVPFAGAFVGNWYTDLNPWRTIGSVLRGGERPDILESWGVWPATVMFVAFTWVELVSPDSGDPAFLGFAALGYTFLMIGVMGFAGRDAGLQSFDAFTSYNRLISAISPLGRDDQQRIVWRGWLRSLPVIPEWPGLWLFVVAMIGTVTYDGASGTEWFDTLSGGIGEDTAGRTLLLIASVGAIAAGYLAVSAAAARLSRGVTSAQLVAQRFAHTLVPIALAYAVAHYFTLVLFEGQQLLAALSDPFGLGWNLFGTAERRIDFFLSSTDLIWYIQVVSIVVGHVLGVVLAHDRALADFGRDAVRSQYAMLALMVGLTTLGLLILSG